MNLPLAFPMALSARTAVSYRACHAWESSSCCLQIDASEEVAAAATASLCDVVVAFACLVLLHLEWHGQRCHEVAVLLALLLLMLRCQLFPPDALWEADSARFNQLLDVPGVAVHAVIPGDVGVVVGVAIGA